MKYLKIGTFVSFCGFVLMVLFHIHLSTSAENCLKLKKSLDANFLFVPIHIDFIKGNDYNVALTKGPTFSIFKIERNAYE